MTITHDPGPTGPRPEPPPARHRRRWPWVVVVVALVVAGVGAWRLWPRPPTPITREDAVADFRADPGDDAAAVGVPEAGVYTYAATGTEDIGMGPVPLPTRDVPAEVTVVVVHDDGCYRSLLNLMVEHTEETTWCLDADGSLSWVAQAKREQVPGFTVDATTTCPAGTVLRSDATELAMSCQLELAVAGQTYRSDLAGRATVEDGGTVAVGDDLVPTRLLTIDLVVDGDFTGHWVERQWLSDARLVPVRIERDIAFDGPGSFVERTTLALVDTAPER